MLTLALDTGDSIEIKLDTSDDLSMRWDESESTMHVKDGDDEILLVIFAGKGLMKECLEGVEGKVKVKDTGSNNGTKYSLFAYDDDDKHYIVGWVVGSDTGIIIEGSDSQKDTMNAFEAMSFAVVDTDQDDEYYYVEGVVIKDSDDKGNNEQTQETENNKDENPDETEPTEPTETTPQETTPTETQPTDEKEDNGNETAKVPSSKLKDCELSINGKVLKLPISYKELKEATGYSIKSSEEKSYLEPDYYASVELRDANGNDICYIDVLNNTDEDASYADCMVIAVSQSEYQTEDAVEIRFVGNLGVGDVTSKDALIKLFGEPSDIYEYRSEGFEDYHFDEYTWDIGSGWMADVSLGIEMNINTGVIEGIHLECNVVD
jgi:hypothetical protein